MDNLTKEQRKKNMCNIRASGTMPEKMVMQELRRRKIYFVKNVVKIPGKPDIVFRKKKIVVFIDSDFWHGHPQRFIMPKTNVEYWSKKIASNVERDIQVTKKLANLGWKVIRIWTCDLNKDFEKSMNLIHTALAEK